jgi:phospholipid/cholesterol/gamma-HCH transport system permease protein
MRWTSWVSIRRVILILPKIVASVLMNPFLVMVSMFLSIFGGWCGRGTGTGIISADGFICRGSSTGFDSRSTVTYALIKTVVFAFIIATVSAYQGYYTIRGVHGR